jgi:nitroimidazol reductase NimA-like FMN-containing flavoprotein (pyridoxamine 5'-phosphate oxidase superfamily)
VTREEQLAAILGICKGESFAVFAFAGDAAADPPYSAVMFFAETPAPAPQLIFATSPGSMKGRYLRAGNGACAQIDTRAVGLANMSQFARVTVQGRLRRADDGSERAELLALYLAKLPNAKAFVERPGIDVYALEPSHIVCARGLFERFELEFPEPPRGAS